MAKEQITTGGRPPRRRTAAPVARTSGKTRGRPAATPSEAVTETVERAETQKGTPMVRWATVEVPVPVAVHLPAPHVRMPHVAVPDPKNAVKQAKWAVQTVRESLPPPRRLAHYGGLGVMAALGALEWPVAAAIGAGVWVAGRAGRSQEKPAGATVTEGEPEKPG